MPGTTGNPQSSSDPAIGALLSDRGYRLTSFENVLGRALTGQPEPVTPPGVEVRPSGDEECEAWLDVVAEGFAHPDTPGVPSPEEFPREVIADALRDLTAAAGVLRYVALRDGILAGGASLRMAQGVAQLTGAATAPAHRREGAGCEAEVVHEGVERLRPRGLRVRRWARLGGNPSACVFSSLRAE
jgi:ribosomal protein S18 acetylase RimI-like enzyme